jgi:hypothetical protein
MESGGNTSPIGLYNIISYYDYYTNNCTFSKFQKKLVKERICMAVIFKTGFFAFGIVRCIQSSHNCAII